MTRTTHTGNPTFWPILVSILLFLACLWCAWLIYQKHAQMAMESAAQREKVLILQEEAESLRKLLRLAPCEAKEQFASSVAKPD